MYRYLNLVKNQQRLILRKIKNSHSVSTIKFYIRRMRKRYVILVDHCMKWTLLSCWKGNISYKNMVKVYNKVGNWKIVYFAQLTIKINPTIKYDGCHLQLLLFIHCKKCIPSNIFCFIDWLVFKTNFSSTCICNPITTINVLIFHLRFLVNLVTTF